MGRRRRPVGTPDLRRRGQHHGPAIVGEFFSTVYKNPALGISKQDRFRRPDRVTEYDCEEEMQQSQYTEEEEGFFD